MTKKLFFFGDSICFGHLTSIHKTFVVRISDQLEKSNYDVVVNNSSVNGNTTRMALERIYHDVLDHQPDILYIQFGLNDCNYWETDKGIPRVAKNVFEANLNEMIDRCFVFGVRKILLATNHPTLKTAPFKYAPYVSLAVNNEVYNAVIRNVAQRRSVFLVDNEMFWMNTSGWFGDLLMPDGVHINEKGHELYSKSIYPIIEEIVKSI